MKFTSSSIATLVGENLSRKYGDYKWGGTVPIPDGCVVGIPWKARHVVIFNPKDQSVTPIGHDLGNGREKWWGGVLVKDRFVYAFPAEETSMLKIDVLTKTVTKLPSPLFSSGRGWKEGVVGIDRNIYAFPCNANFIIKVDTSNDVISTVGNDFDFGQGRAKYGGTVKANNGLLYGIPRNTKRITKYDPATDTTSLVGHEAEEAFICIGNGALAANGHIYALTDGGKILEIEVADNTHSIVATAPLSIDRGWWGTIEGEDSNVYFHPSHASRVMMLNTTTKVASLVGEHLGNDPYKWFGGAKKSLDGIIYCLPFNADNVLAIDTNPSDLSHRNVNADPTNSVPVDTKHSPFLYDVFLSHTWAKDGLGRDNHQRVELVYDKLKARGIRAWFDKQQMKGNILQRMAEGIDASLTVAVFVSNKYLDKVASRGNDNCKFEYEYALGQKTVEKMIPVAMEEVPSPWKGTVGLTMGSQLYYSFKTNDELDQCVDDLVNRINEIKRQNTS